MNSPDHSLNGVVQPPSSSEPLTIVRVPRLVEMYYVSGQELDGLASGFSSVHLAFFGMTFGACVTLLVTLFTVTLSDRQNAAFVVLAAASVLATLYFGIRALPDQRSQVRRVREIKKSRPA